MPAPRLLWGVQERSYSPTLVAGCLAAAATTGALLAMGRRLGSVRILFAAIGTVLLRTPIAITIGAALTGLVLHLAGAFVWSALAVRLARGFRRRLLAAGLTATTQFTVSWIVAWWTGRGLSSVLALGDRLVYAVVLACALVVGMRFAFLMSRNAPTDARSM